MQLVGVLNITPDSFSDGGLFLDAKKAFVHAEQLFADGARIIDIGAEATNPWASEITAEKEWQRLKPVLIQLQPLLRDLNFSIDTRHAEIVENVTQLLGAIKFYVSDVTTFIHPDMRAVTAAHGLHAIVSHAPLIAQGNIQNIHRQKISSAAQVLAELRQQQALLIEAGVLPEHIILDPGIGFGKTMQLNWQLLEFGKLLPGESIMIGFSNKRFLATNPSSGEKLANETIRYSDAANQKAADVTVKTCQNFHNSLLLRVHNPEVYSKLL